MSSSKPSVPIPQQHFRKASEEPLGAWQRKSQALSRSGSFDIVPVPFSMLETAGHYRHDEYLGSLAPELSLPLGWQESPVP